ncbi:mechanosensitive ion channel protein 1, mitochondrial-like [Actinidia eriantha]|uniref:mechanosensitive ion channel protein 1, mitochondrial-like n=1 Tax=Actinidia eriantha TaxID=165200 RepID=UPI00258F65CF|nr:mechanosensitive ion channel protein 1, mitochondrial-like [Actinidia eriantha]XP_057495846.1 mechanosensitive ion channel protein 1, mitochondrial-like [Actinidia eriantha]
MASIRFSILKSLCSSSVQFSRQYGCYSKIEKFGDKIDVRPSFACICHNYHTKESGFDQNNLKNGFRMMGLESLGGSQYNRTNIIRAFAPTISNPCFRSHIAPTAAISPVLNYRSYSSLFGGKGDRNRDPEVATALGGGESSVSESGGGGPGGTEIADMVKNAWQTVEDGMTYTVERAKEASTELSPHVQQWLDQHPYLRDVIVPVSFTLTATVLAWVVLPRVLRRLHKYSTQGPAALLSGMTLWGPILYEKSFWGALEDPLRYLLTFMAFSQIGMMVAPTTIASQYITPAWRGAVIISFVWFLHRWKTNVFARAMEAASIRGIEREKLLTLDKISSVGFFVLGLMALAEACGVAVQSILTVGGIGGVATAFAARDVLGNVLSGLSVQFSQPFSIGDTIKAGSVEGQVVEMGLMTTSLLSAEKFPIIVPNSLFSSQVIVNKSRAQWRAMVTKIPLQIDDLSKIPQISEDIKNMLRLNLKVFLEKEPPYCFLSRIERSYAELTLGCNLKHASKDELFSTQQDILLQAVQIIKQHGAKLGSTLEDMTSQ